MIDWDYERSRCWTKGGMEKYIAAREDTMGEGDDRLTARDEPAGSAHSPLPWRLNGKWNGIISGDNRAVLIDEQAEIVDVEFIVTAVNCHDELVAALKAAHDFIRNGIGLGYIRMPDRDLPDPAHLVPEQVRAAIATAEGRQ